MNISTNGDYNPCQMNETINFSPDGKVLSKSLMLNLRGETVKEVWKAYQELRKLIDGEKNVSKKRNKKAQKENKQNEKDQKKSEDTCPECGGLLVEKQGISSKTGMPYHFKGCSNFPTCRFTRAIPEKEPIPVADEDLIGSISY